MYSGALGKAAWIGVSCAVLEGNRSDSLDVAGSLANQGLCLMQQGLIEEVLWRSYADIASCIWSIWSICDGCSGCSGCSGCRCLCQ